MPLRPYLRPPCKTLNKGEGTWIHVFVEELLEHVGSVGSELAGLQEQAVSSADGSSCLGNCSVYRIVPS